MADTRTILLAGASRGLGLGLAQAYVRQGWRVIATARDPAAAVALGELAREHPQNLRVERLDVAQAGDAAALAGRLAGVRLDVLFVVAGINAGRDTAIADMPAEVASMEFLTNAVGPVALADRLAGVTAPGATVVFMTSILGSIASNAGGSVDLYRASKAALNMLASCFALRRKENPVVLLHPGWVRTEMGGAQAPVDVETSVAGMMGVIAARHGKPGLVYQDYQGKPLPW